MRCTSYGSWAALFLGGVFSLCVSQARADVADRISCTGVDGATITYHFNRPANVGRWAYGLLDCVFWVVAPRSGEAPLSITSIDPATVSTQALMQPAGSNQPPHMYPYVANGAEVVSEVPMPGFQVQNIASRPSTANPYRHGLGTDARSGEAYWIDPDFDASLVAVYPAPVRAGDTWIKAVSTWLPDASGTLQSPLARLVPSSGRIPMTKMLAQLFVVNDAPAPDALPPAMAGPSALRNHHVTLGSLWGWLSRIVPLYTQSQWDNQILPTFYYGSRVVLNNIQFAMQEGALAPLGHWTDSQGIPFMFGTYNPATETFVTASYGLDKSKLDGLALISATIRPGVNNTTRLALIARMVNAAIQTAGMWHAQYAAGVTGLNQTLGGKSLGEGMLIVAAGVITQIPELYRIYSLLPNAELHERQVTRINPNNGDVCAVGYSFVSNIEMVCNFAAPNPGQYISQNYTGLAMSSGSELYAFVEALGGGRYLPNDFRRMMRKFIEVTAVATNPLDNANPIVYQLWPAILALHNDIPNFGGQSFAMRSKLNKAKTRSSRTLKTARGQVMLQGLRSLKPTVRRVITPVS